MNNPDPSPAQLADWWLTGSLLAEPADLLRNLLADYHSLEQRLALCKQDETDAVQGEIALQDQLDTKQQRIDFIRNALAPIPGRIDSALSDHSLVGGDEAAMRQELEYLRRYLTDGIAYMDAS